MDLRKGKIPAPVDVLARQRMEKIAMQAVLDAEKALGHEVVDVSSQTRISSQNWIPGGNTADPEETAKQGIERQDF